MDILIAKCKNWAIEHKKELLLFMLIFLVSSISFALGYLMARDQGRAPIIIERASSTNSE